MKNTPTMPSQLRPTNRHEGLPGLPLQGYIAGTFLGADEGELPAAQPALVAERVGSASDCFCSLRSSRFCI